MVFVVSSSKEKDEMLIWMFKFGPHKKQLRMLLFLCFLSLVVMFSILLLYLAKGWLLCFFFYSLYFLMCLALIN